MTAKKLIGRFHLWIGLTTGLVVFIMAITGALYCFAPELQNLSHPYRTIEKLDKDFLPPSQIKTIAENQLSGKSPQRIYYGNRSQSVMVWFSKLNEYDSSVFINPYTGEVLNTRNNNRDFFTVVLKIHRTLLIPYGHEIIRWSSVGFLIMLISGIILWWPRNRRTARHGFRVMWRASPKRLNYDLHKVLGFYATWIAIFTVLTGMMFAFKGFADVTYKLTGSNKSFIQKDPPLSDTSNFINQEASLQEAAIDVVWNKIEKGLHHKYAAAMFVMPASANNAILLRANPEERTLYKTDFRYFDQYSGKEIDGSYVWGNYEDARTLSDHIKRMNYDIHTGAIFGLPGRIALFFASLIVASLPITGFYFWWGKKRKANRVKKFSKK